MKPGPKVGKEGKKKVVSFTLKPSVYKTLQDLAKIEEISASKWLELRIQSSWKALLKKHLQ